MDLHFLILFFAAFTSAVALPGPNVAFAIAQAIKHGPGTAVPGALGFGLATAIHATVVLSGVGFLTQENPWVLAYLRWLGAMYLAYVAVNTFLSKSDQSVGNAENPNSKQMFAGSLFVALTNPKGWLTSLLTYPNFINPYFPYTTQAISLGLAACAISLLIYGGYMVFAHKARIAFRNTSIFNKVTAVLYALVALGLVLFPY